MHLLTPGSVDLCLRQDLTAALAGLEFRNLPAHPVFLALASWRSVALGGLKPLIPLSHSPMC